MRQACAHTQEQDAGIASLGLVVHGAQHLQRDAQGPASSIGGRDDEGQRHGAK